MKKTILYTLSVIAAIAIAVFTVFVGCDGDLGERSGAMDTYLDKFHYNKRVLPKYTLTYDGNGADSGDVPKGPTMYDSGTTVSILDAGTLIKYGSSFSGWNSQADGNGASYSKEGGGASGIKITHDITLYAKWDSGVTYAVIVKSSPVGMSVSGGRRYKPDETVTIAAEESSDGWRFQNWTAANNAVSFADAEKAETSFRMPKKDVTVTAVFVADGGKMDLLTDDRDGNVYITVTILGQTWMARNLDYLNDMTTGDSSWCYDNDPDNCTTYGRLYTWDAAKTACPAGWRLPDTADWNRLINAGGGANVADKKLKSSTGWNSYSGISSTDDYGFSALPGGSRNYDGPFGGAGSNGVWWTATEDGDYGAYYRDMSYNYDNVGGGGYSKGAAFSARCIKND